MNKLQPFFAGYIRSYIKKLTEAREEFFLSLCDIEDEALQDLDSLEFTGYQVVAVSRSDYSEAVRMRNDIQIKKIVLLSAEGVKQIDSLKDFNEYSVLSEDRELLWSCLEEAFQIELNPKVRGFLEVILDQSEVSFWELFQYLKESILRGKLSAKRLNKNLPMLGIWKSNRDEVLKKGRIHRIISFSKYSVMDNGLTRAMMNHRIADKEIEKAVSRGLAKGDMQEIRMNTFFEDVEQYLKSTPREKTESSLKVEQPEENCYRNSYEYKLKEEILRDIPAIEQEWMQAGKHSEEETEADWKSYKIVRAERIHCRKEIERLLYWIGSSNLPSSRVNYIAEKLQELLKAFREAAAGVEEASPVCLQAFCNRAEGYAQIYFELITGILMDEAYREGDAASKLIQDICLLFCRVTENKIQMSYFHPVRIFYYMCMKGIYEHILDTSSAAEWREAENLVEYALAEKLSMQFPVEFLRIGKKQYALDHTTISKGYTEFVDTEAGTVYSVLDFKVVQPQILSYLRKHPFLTEITICMVDISSLAGLLGLSSKIKAMAEECHICRVDFLILSVYEEELKEKLSELWDGLGTGDLIRFRFVRDRYQKEEPGGKSGYDLEAILRDADMTILADNAMLYTEPRPVPNREANNQIYNRLKKFLLREQAENYFRRESSDVPVIWDTLQQLSVERQEGFWRWRIRELKSGLLTVINRKVQEDAAKSIVLLSSNEHILSEIYKTEYMQAWRKHNGESIMILSFQSGRGVQAAEDTGIIMYSLREFYDGALDLEELQEILLPGLSDVLLKISYDKGRFICECVADKEESEELAYNWKERCREWLDWQFGSFLEEKQLLTRYFKELWLNQLFAGGSGTAAALMAECLCQGSSLEIRFRESDDWQKEWKAGKQEGDCAEAVRIHELLQFLAGIKAMDERTVSQFKDRYDVRLLDRLLDSEQCRGLLGTQQEKRMIKIREKIGEQENGQER